MARDPARTFVVLMALTTLAGVALIAATAARVGAGADVPGVLLLVLAAVVVAAGLAARSARPGRQDSQPSS